MGSFKVCPEGVCLNSCPALEDSIANSGNIAPERLSVISDKVIDLCKSDSGCYLETHGIAEAANLVLKRGEI